MTRKVPTHYTAISQDGSLWRISRCDVIKDMLEYEGEDDRWPKPIPEQCVRDWLGDNADEIEGWSLALRAEPERSRLTCIKAEYACK